MPETTEHVDATVKRGALRWNVALALAVASASCAAPPRVVRVYDGTRVEGTHVSPDAYAAFLRGVLAEASRDFAVALDAYERARNEDDSEPEISTRIGAVRCARDPRDPEIDRAFARALGQDPRSASAFAAKARCALARGHVAEAAELMRRATAEDPKDVALAAFAVRVGARAGDPAARARAIALTESHGHHEAAWDALIAWGHARRDAALVARGLEGLVRAAPTRSGEVERGALALLVGGEPALARRVAMAIADAPRVLGVSGPRDPTVARIAVDEALARGDAARALALATRGHVSLAEVAARALLLGQSDAAKAVARSVLEADPSATDARMVIGALEGAVLAIADVTGTPPSICAFVFADRLATSAGTEAARTWLAQIARAPMPAHDPLAGPLAVDLAARGVLPATLLPPALRAAVQRGRARAVE